MIPKYLFRSGALAMLVALVPALPAQAATATVDTSVCNTNPVFSQPFLPFGDSNEYTLAPGQNPDAFTGTGWTLTGGASVVSSSLADGTTGTALELTYGSEAVSPVLCVQSNYPTARMEVRDLVGPPSIQFEVSYETTTGWTSRKPVGAPGVPNGWTLSPPLNLSPQNVAGWQPVKFYLLGTGKSDTALLYNLYVDPRMAK